MKDSAKQAGEGQGRNRVWTRPWIKFSLASPAGFMLTMLLAAVALGGGVVMRVSTDSVGVQAYAYSGYGSSYYPSISADGRYVAFSSEAPNLVPGDTNGIGDVFVKDTLTGATSRVSTDSGGNQGNSGSNFPSLSADGRFVAFESSAYNLVPGDTNGMWDVFVKDTQTGATTRVSTDLSGNQGNSYSYEPSLSANGRYVAFESKASNLVPYDINGARDVFVKDTQTGAITRASTSSSGNQGSWTSYQPSLSADGRFVAFESSAYNLVPGDTNGIGDVFVKDTQTGATTRVSTDLSGNQGSGESGDSSISADGRFVSFSAWASNLVTGDTNGVLDVFLAETSITCTAGEPDLALQKTDIFWGSYADYTARLLSIDLKVKNNGMDAAYIVQVTGATNTNGVSCVVCMSSLGNLTAGSEHSFTLKYNIPTGVTAFSTTLAATAQDGCGTGYTYP